MSHDQRSHRDIAESYKDPETPIPRAAKKEAVLWVVRGMCLIACLGLIAIARSWADERYTQKLDMVAREAATDQRLVDEKTRREALEAQQQDIIRKLDLLIYIAQRNGTISPNEMKGKLSPP